jgi:hypothetical protein
MLHGANCAGPARSSQIRRAAAGVALTLRDRSGDASVRAPVCARLGS